ncbi:MAG: hypothetical protein IPM37_06535 [Hahellaceae bacterium]|jgi:predicted lipoprotein|nr:hypothetical protein [Hahellaceae bacterium]
MSKGRQITAVALCAVMLSAGCASTESVSPPPPEVPDLQEQIVRLSLSPMKQFEVEAKGFTESWSDVCQDQVVQQKELATLQDKWRIVVTSWARASVFSVGPTLDDNRKVRVSAWPVRPGLVDKQTHHLLGQASSLPANEVARLVHQGSAAVQGLPALDFLLFAPGSERIDQINKQSLAFCHAGLAISSYLHETSATLFSAWESWPVLNAAQSESRQLSDPRPLKETPAFHRLQDKLLNGLLSQIRHLNRDGVGSLFDYSNDPKGKQRNLHYPYSQYGTDSLKYSLEALSTALRSDSPLITGLAEDSAHRSALNNRINALLEDAGKLPIVTNGQPLSPEDVQTIQNLNLHLEGLYTLLESKLLPELGLTVDFNSEDGD